MATEKSNTTTIEKETQSSTPGPTVSQEEEIVASEEVINHNWNLEEATIIYKEARNAFLDKHLYALPDGTIAQNPNSDLWETPKYKNSQSWAKTFKAHADSVALTATKTWAIDQPIWKASGLTDDQIGALEVSVAWAKVTWIDHPLFKQLLPTAQRPEDKPSFGVFLSKDTKAWTKASVNKHTPYFHKPTQEYRLAIKTKYSGTGGEETSSKYISRLQEIKTEACQWLLDFFFKEYDEDLLTKLVKVSNHEYHLKNRPNAKMKALIKVPAKYFNAIPSKEETFDFDHEEITKRRLNIASNDLELYVDFVAEELRKYKVFLKNSNVTLKYGSHELRDAVFDYTEHADQLEDLFDEIEELFINNGLSIRPDKEDLIEIGFSSSCRDITYVLYGDSDRKTFEMLPLRIGFNSFTEKVQKSPTRSSRYLLYSAPRIIDYVKEKNPESDRWLEVTKRYIKPDVKVLPAAPINNSEKTVKEIVTEAEKERTNSSPYVTLDEKRQEDYTVNDPNARRKVVERRKAESDPIDPEPPAAPKNIDEAYDNIYNKTDQDRVAALAISCMLKMMPEAELLLALKDKILRANPDFDFTVPNWRAKGIRLAMPKLAPANESLNRDRRDSRLPNLSKLTFMFPDNLPMYGDTLQDAMEAFTRGQERILNSLIGLATFPETCDDLQNKLNEFGNLINIVEDLKDDLCDILSRQLGYPAGRCPEEFVDDLFGSLSGQEMKDLLAGQPSREAEDHISDLLTTHSLPLTNIKSLFKNLGRNINIDEFAEVCIPLYSRQWCSDDSFKQLLDKQKNLLAGDGTTEEQINKQLEKDSKQRIAALKNLSDLLAADNLDHLMPPNKACKEADAIKELESEIKDSSISAPIAPAENEEPASIQYLTDKVITQMYSETQLAFDLDSSNYLESTIKTKEITLPKLSAYKLNEDKTEFIPSEGKPDPSEMTAPEGRTLRADYDPSKNFIDGDETIIHPDNHETVRTQEVLGDLKNNLANFAKSHFNFSGATFYNFNGSVAGYEGPVIRYATNLAGQQIGKLDTAAMTVTEVVSVNQTGITEGQSTYDSLTRDLTITSKVPADVRSKIEELDIMPDKITASPQSQVFSKYLLKNIPAEIKNANIRETIEGLWAHNYGEFQQYFSKLISEADFFDKNVLDKLSLLPPNQSEKETTQCKGLPKKSLLDIDGVKSKVKDSYKEAQACSPEIGSPESINEMSPLESSGLEGAIYTFARLLSVELLLNAAPVFSIFKAEDICRDNLFLQFALEKLNEELRLFDVDFYEDFAGHALKSLNKRQEKEGELKDPVTQTPIAVTTGDEAIRFIVKEQLLAVSDDIDDIFGPEDDANSLIKDKILNEWIGPEQIIPEVKLDPRGSGRYVTQPRFSEKENFEDDAGFTHKTNPQFANGQFFLERYFKIDEKEGPVSAFSSQIPEHLKGIVNMKQWQEWAKLNIKEEFAQTNIDTRLDIKMGVRLMYLPPLENFSFTRRINTSEIGKEIVLGTDPDTGVVWVGTSDGVIFDSTSTHEFSSLFGSKTLDNPSALYNKAFAVTELLQSGETSFLDSEHEHSIKGDLERVVNPIPIVVIEKSAHEMLASLGIETFGDIKSSDNKISWLDVTLNQEALDPDWYSAESIKIMNKFSALKEELKNSQEFDIVFNYCYDMSRLVSLFVTYCATITRSSNLELARSFNTTKGALKNLFYTLLQSSTVKPYYSNKDPKSSELGSNAEMKKAADNAVSTDGTVGYPIAQRMASMTIPMMIKGYAERSDPSIKLMKALDLPTVWTSVPKVLPMNVIPFAPGPPLTPLGFLTLGFNFKTPYEKSRERNDPDSIYSKNLNDSEPEELTPGSECDPTTKEETE